MFRRLLAFTAAALLAGAAASTTVLLVAGYRYAPVRSYEVTVELSESATEEHKSAIRSELDDAPGEVVFENREEALARFRKEWKDDPERVAGVQVESMSESFRLTSEGREFDCAPIPRIRELPGVERLWVVMEPTASRPGAEIGC
ncbi:permease-like cell division protein FtsX [Actinoplanes sp. NPDC023936]|uniref:permease-like cell division protein FtsX n=1 Tax=Actinoplanes sp. NPDC023936 TaxID=3154910 RepID=UPI0033F1EAB9